MKTFINQLTVSAVLVVLMLFCSRSLVHPDEFSNHTRVLPSVSLMTTKDLSVAIKMEIFKEGKFDANAFEAMRWKLQAIGKSIIPCLLELLQQVNSQSIEDKVISGMIIDVLIGLKDPVLPYITNPPPSLYKDAQMIYNEIQNLNRIKEMSQGELLATIDEAVKVIISGVDEDNISERMELGNKVQIANSRSAAKILVEIGTPAIPYLIPLSYGIMSSNLKDGPAAGIAVHVITEIGEPALTYLRHPQYSDDEIIQRIKEGLCDRLDIQNKAIEKMTKYDAIKKSDKTGLCGQLWYLLSRQ